MTAAVTFKVVESGQRRVVAVSPATRPELRSPQAHPRRTGHLGGDTVVASCAVTRPARPSGWLRLKVAAVAMVAVAGGVVSVAQFVTSAVPEAPQGYVAGDPAWSHVAQP